MNVARPYAILRRSIDGDILRVLAGTTDAMTGRQVHRLVGRGSHRTVQTALTRLAEEGLLDVREYGPAKLYTFNRAHLAADPVLGLLAIRSRLIERLRSTIANWDPAVAHASLFGSAARGDGDEKSDIDLLLVRPNGVDPETAHWRAQVDRLREDVARWTGNRPAISELSESDLNAMSADKPPILRELLDDAVVLSGPRFSDYMRALP